MVDPDKFSLFDLNSDLLDELSWEESQTPKIWILDKKEGRDAALMSEAQIPEMFKMFQKEKKILLRVVVCDSDGSSKCSGTDGTFQCTPGQPIPTIITDGQSYVGSSHGCSISGPSGGMSQNSQSLGEPSQFNDPDPDDDEYVGFNDECMYNSDGDDGLDQNHSAKNAAQEVQLNSDLIMTDSVHEEPTVDDTVHTEPLFTHDLENPKIEVGASFPDVSTFRRALRHFAFRYGSKSSTHCY
jgi:hypothetical protein